MHEQRSNNNTCTPHFLMWFQPHMAAGPTTTVHFIVHVMVSLSRERYHGAVVVVQVKPTHAGFTAIACIGSPVSC